MTAMYQPSQLTLALARARTNDLLAEAEAARLAATAKAAQPRRPWARIPAVLRLNHHRQRRPRRETVIPSS